MPILTEDHLYRMVGRELFAWGLPGGDRIGLELELFPVIAGTDGAIRNVRLDVADPGEVALLEWLTGLAERRGWNCEIDPYRNLRIEMPGGGTITLEPACQIEYSGPPADAADDAVADLESFVGAIVAEGESSGIRFVARGYNGFSTAPGELEIRKPRYIAMDRHFGAIGPFGRAMMRSTCALQMNVDFGGEGSAAERWRLANMIAPSLNAIFANAPGEYDGKHYRSFRYEIWRRLDPSRTGRLYDRPDLDPVADYLRFALDASVMMVRGGAHDPDGFCSPAGAMTFREWMAGGSTFGYPDWEDWRIHLSTLFPDVRARGYMELRSIDALPRQYRRIAVGFVAALLRNDRLRARALARIESRERCKAEGEHEHGGYWRSDFETGRELFRLFLDHLPRGAERDYFATYLDDVLARDLTPSDISPTLDPVAVEAAP